VLCRVCQKNFGHRSEKITKEARDLFQALLKRGVPAELEKEVGYMTVDIAIPDAMVNIEVDGGHHNFDAGQALRDLKRTYHAFRKGYLTLRIPNSLIKANLEQTADYITDFLNESLDQLDRES
jgi:very-short-patch-repair endonuclease